MTDDEDALDYHAEKKGKIRVEGKTPLETMGDLQKAYTPGVAAVSRAIEEDPDTVYDYTSKGEMVGIVSNGSATLGMGDIGPEAAIPVMEGKALLVRRLGGVSAFPVMLDVDDPEAFTETAERLHPMFGFMMLEDIDSPHCFQIEEALKERLDIPVYHDDQHGAAIAVLAGLENALEVVGKDLAEVTITVVGIGAAGTATVRLLDAAGAENIIPVGRQGILQESMETITEVQREVASEYNAENREGDLADAMKGADVVVGLSTGGIISEEMVASMEDDPIVFALANPDPEIMPGKAHDAGAAVVATGRSDFPNQINNSLVFPGVARG
ncbi:MAG: NADP-dependent malic enzyme, partial [Candidatus Nanohaloarchaea archaeon]